MSAAALYPWQAGSRPGLPFMADKDMAFLTLDEAGAVVDCDGPVEELFGYAPRDLIFRHVSLLLPRLLYMELMPGGQINSRLHYLCHIGLPFRVQPREGGEFLGALSLTDLGNPAGRRVRLGIRRR